MRFMTLTQSTWFASEASTCRNTRMATPSQHLNAPPVNPLLIPSSPLVAPRPAPRKPKEATPSWPQPAIPLPPVKHNYKSIRYAFSSTFIFEVIDGIPQTPLVPQAGQQTVGQTLCVQLRHFSLPSFRLHMKNTRTLTAVYV